MPAGHTRPTALKTPRGRLLVLAVATTFLGGCYGVHVRPLPEPELRAETQIRGVVRRDDGAEARTEFKRVDNVEWTDSTVALTGQLTGRSGTVVTRTFPLAGLDGILVREFNTNAVSLAIAGAALVGGAIWALTVTGTADPTTQVPGG